MPFYFTHAGTSLQKVSAAGVPSTVTLPAGVTMSATRRGRFSAMGNMVVCVHAPSINVAIDLTTLTAYPMTVIAPTSALTPAAGAAGVLTGTYAYKVTYSIQDGTVVLSESNFSAASADVTLSAQKGALTNIPVSPDATVTNRRLYRTTSGGSTYFFLAAIDNNDTTYTDDTPDAGLSTIAAPTDLGEPAGATATDYLRDIVSWQGRFWALSSVDVDNVYFSGVDKFYGWPATYFLPIHPTGQSEVGCNAFIPRRDELGVSKQEGLSKIVGTGVSDYRVVPIISAYGVLAPDSVVVIRDTAYFLAADGVYSWGADGVNKVSNRVDPWFITDDFFDRSRFVDAFARWNIQEDTYELHLSSNGSSTHDQWVSFDLGRGLWLGPHTTTAFVPTAGGQVETIAGVPVSVIGASNGHIYRANSAAYADVSSAIAFDMQTGWLQAGSPNTTKAWGQLVLHSGIETQGVVTITPYVGGLDALPGEPLLADLTKGRERLPRLGVGRLMSLRFQQARANEPCRILGFECKAGIRGTR